RLTGLRAKQHHRFAEDPAADGSLAELRAPGCDIRAISDEHVRLPVLSSSFENKIGGALGDHDRRRIGIAADDRRHDRRVADPQFVNATDLQGWINDRVTIDAHAASTDWM